MEEVYILSAVRTPIGSFGGVLKDIEATRLGAAAIQAALDRAGIPATDVHEVLMGSVIQANLGQAPARQAAKFAGLPDAVHCTTVNKVCASGMKSIMQAAQGIRLGDIDVAIAGGMESMSRVPFYSDSMRWGNKYGDTKLVDGLAKDGLTDVYHGYAMGCAADACATEHEFSREAQDAYAIESYQRSQAAWDAGKFDAEVVPVSIPSKKGDATVISRDEEPWNVKFDKIPGLRPAFGKDGTVTAANASTMNDGAAALVLASGRYVQQHGLKPIAKIRSYSDAEQAPEQFTTTPALALPRAVDKAGLAMADLDYVEINEAFSVVALANMKLMGLDQSRVNIHGGAVSIGHPLGCSGARIVVTLIHVLKAQQARIGGAAICNGGGGASAMVIELV